MDSLPLGVHCRSDTGKLYFEIRVGEFKLYSTRIQSVQEGALCHDISRRYISQLIASRAPGGKRKALQELNYPEYSSGLVLEDLPVEFTKEKKDRVMEVVLRQAQAAAQAMPEREHARSWAKKVQKHSRQDVGSRSVDKRSLSKKDACTSSPGVKEHSNSAGNHIANDCEKLFDDVCAHALKCKFEYMLKVSEREELERKVKDMTGDSGYISFKKSGSDKFHEHMARFKQLVCSDGFKFPSWVEACEQKYMSEKYKCIKLQKELEGHNMKSIHESLVVDGNKMTGRRRANEEERLPPVLEIFPTAEKNSCSTPTEVSAFCAPPTSTPVADCIVPYHENDNTVPSTAESYLSEPVASYEFALGDKYSNEDIHMSWSSLADDSTHTGCRRENEDARPAELCAHSNDEGQFLDQWKPDWSDALFFYTQN